MKKLTLKIVFQTNEENGAVKWENLYDEVDAILTSNRKPSLKVIMKNVMLRSEMDAIVRELCSFISTKFKCRANSRYYDDACVAAGYDDIFVSTGYNYVLCSATYYIEIVSLI